MYNNIVLNIDFSWQYFAEDFENNLLKLAQLTKLAYQHEIQVIYNDAQLIDFRTHLIDLDANFSESLGNKLEVILRNASRSKRIGHLFKINNLREQSQLNYSIPVYSIISDIHGMISLNPNIQGESKYLLISDDDFNTIEFMGCYTNLNLLDCVKKRGEKRSFHFSDKHGENGTGNWPGESVLLCSCVEANTLLQSAIPDFNKKKDRLFNFDEKHNCFIEFFYEGNNPQKQWHGFHLQESLWTTRVPNSILKFYKK